jgi:formylglycine-generating enzyme required for sulfatase activity
VSWHDAKAYVKWLEETTRRPYRLLSEAEWEYCCRARNEMGNAPPFWWGTAITPAQANYDANYTYKGGGSKGEWRKGTVPVHSFDPNPWGLYQVHGNVWEWCEDVWHDTYDYKGTNAPSDGSAWIEGGDASRRVARGGSWFVHPAGLRAACRTRDTTDDRDNSCGFRVARIL